MKGLPVRIRSRLRLTLALTAAAAAALAGASVPASAATTHRHHHKPPYLALGDSVPFGYITGDGNAYVNQRNFVGYPVYVGRRLHLHTVNAACPGEATGGFVSATDPDDNGCRAYKAAYPLHVPYTGTQLSYAEHFLTAHPGTRLVTLMLGANDGFRLEAQCNYQIGCILAGVNGLLATITKNYNTIIKGLRATGYRGPIMIVDYYSLDYTDSQQTLLSQTLDQTLAQIAKRHHLLLANVFTAMKQAAAVAGGNTCQAGLLNVNPSDTSSCDVHPSQSGHRVIAGTIARTYRAWAAKH